MSITSAAEAARARILGNLGKAVEWTAAHPHGGNWALTAGIVAPWLLSNDERGYLKTSLITSPLILAGAAMSEPMIKIMRATGNSVMQAGRNAARGVPQDISSSFLRKARREMIDGNLTANRFREMELQYLSNYTPREADVAEELQSMTQTFGKMMADTSSHDMIRHAINAEVRRNSHASEILGVDESSGEAVFNLLGPGASDIDMHLRVAEMSDRPEFVRGLNGRLQTIQHLEDRGAYLGVLDNAKDDLKLMEYEYEDIAEEWKKFSPSAKRLFDQRKEVFEQLSDHIASGRLKPEQLKIVGLGEAGGNVAELHGFRIYDRDLRNSVYAGFYNHDIRGTILGKNRMAWSRQVGDLKNGLMEADLFAAKYADHRLFKDSKTGKLGLNDALNRLQDGGFVDKADDSFQSWADTDERAYQLDILARDKRHEEVMMNYLDGFGKDKDIGWMDLPPVQLEKDLAAMVERGVTKTGSPGSSNKGIFNTPQAAEKYPAGFYDPVRPLRQDAMIKPVMASNSPVGGSAGKPFSRTTYLAEELKGFEVPEFRMRVGAVSAELKTIAEMLPSNPVSLWETDVEGRILSQLEKAQHVSADVASRASAQKTWEKMRSWITGGLDMGIHGQGRKALYEGGQAWKDAYKKLQDVKKLAYLGEPDYMLVNKTGLPQYVLNPTSFYLDEVRIPDIEQAIAEGRVFDQKDSKVLLGNLRDTEQFVDTRRFAITGMQRTPKGTGPTSDKIELLVNQIDDLEHAKIHAHGKGLTIGTSRREAGNITAFVNEYNEGMGFGKLADDINALSIQSYSHNKANAFEQLLNIASDTMTRADMSSPVMQAFTRDMAGVGFQFNDGILEDVQRSSHLSWADRQDRVSKTIEVIERHMAEVGDRIRSGQLKADSFLKGYTGDIRDSLTQYIQRNGSPVNAAIWDSLHLGVPQDATVTYDLLGQLSMRGHHGTMKELIRRSRIDGDIQQTEAVIRHMDAGNYTKALDGSPVLTVDQAFQGMSMGSDGRFHRLSNPQVRAGTVLDPGHEIAAGNWSLQLSDDSYVPVLGHDAYGGKVNRYAGGFSTNDREKSLLNIVAADKRGDMEARAGAIEAYNAELKQFGLGKEGYLRARRTDPFGLSGFVQTRPRSAQNHVFEVAINERMLSRVDRRTAQMLKSGEDVFAVLSRHPISSAPFVRVALDKHLNDNVIGVPEALRGLILSDDDKDGASLFFIRKDMPNAYAEARLAVDSKKSMQSWEQGLAEMFEGVEDNPEKATKTFLESVVENAKKLIGRNPVDNIVNRSAGGAVGRLSNLLTASAIGLETNTKVLDPKAKLMMHRALWTPMRQFSIAAQKSTDAGMGIARVMTLAKNMEEGLDKARTVDGFGKFYSTVSEILASTAKTAPKYDARMADYGIQLTPSISEKINRGNFRPLFEWWQQNEESVRQFHEGMDKDVMDAMRSITGTEGAVKGFSRSMGELQSKFPYLISNPSRLQKQAEQSGMKDFVARMLGDLNEVTRNSGSSARRMFAEPGVRKSLGIGLGVAALAGLATTSLKSPRSEQLRPSGNAFRPERNVGTQDHIPGEAVEGSMAPGSPPRRMVAAPTQTNTAIVAPVHQAVDLEVRAKNPDRRSAVEQAKMLARMSTNGDSVVTVNYRTNPRHRSLRMREKMRDELQD